MQNLFLIDGDVVNKNTSVSFHLADTAADAAWGPDAEGACACSPSPHR